jgi:hypothetical protein
LFTDEENKRGICTHTECWDEKEKAVYRSKVIAAVEKGYILGHTTYYQDTFSFQPLLKELGDLKTENINDWHEVTRPEKPKKSDADSKHELAQMMKEWAKEVSEFAELSKSGKIFPVFMMNGSSQGKVLRFRKGSERAAGKDKPKMDSLPPKEQAKRIEENLARRDDIAMNLMTQQVYDSLEKKTKEYTEHGKPLTNVEKLGLLYLLSTQTIRGRSQGLKEIIMGSMVKPHKDLQKLTDMATRVFLMNVLKPSKETRPGHEIKGDLLHALVKEWMPDAYEEHTKVYKRGEMDRHNRVKDRVKALKK